MKKYVVHVTCLALVGLLIGCSQETSTPSTSDQTHSASAPAVDGSQFLLSSEPEGAADVISVREQAEDQDDVVIAGRIGGSENPWVDGRAAFSIVDASLKSCLECGSVDCPKPWDYC